MPCKTDWDDYLWRRYQGVKLKEAGRRKRQASETPTPGKTGNPNHLDVDTRGSRQREQRYTQPEVDPTGKTTETNEKSNSFIYEYTAQYNQGKGLQKVNCIIKTAFRNETPTDPKTKARKPEIRS